MSDAVIGPLEERYRRSRRSANASDQTQVTTTHYPHRDRQRARLGLRRHGRGDIRAGHPAADQGVRRQPDRVALRPADRASDRHRRHLFLALAGGPGRPPRPAGDQHRDVLADDADRALTTTFTAFIAARCVVSFALNGEWALGSLLVAETWPARLRGRVIGINRGTWCFGAAAAGAIATWVFTDYGWRVAFVIPPVVALIAVYVRAKCPESPLLGSHAGPQAAHQGNPRGRRPDLIAKIRNGSTKSAKIPLRQLFMPDMWRNTAAATFVACCSTIIYGTVGGWMPLYLAKERGWSAIAIRHLLHLVGI